MCELLDLEVSQVYSHLMTYVNTAEAKRDLSSLLKKVAAGETVIIGSRNKPIAEMKPILSRREQPRPLGLCVGEFDVPDDFNEPLPEDIVKDFEAS